MLQIWMRVKPKNGAYGLELEITEGGTTKHVQVGKGAPSVI